MWQPSEEVTFVTLLFYSSIELQSLHMDDSFKTMVPQETKKAILSHSIFSPLEVSVDANGSFGSMSRQVLTWLKEKYIWILMRVKT